LILLGSLLAVSASREEAACAVEAFPRKPIKIVVYTKGGGPIDFTARKFVDIAAKYTDATFVVENKEGAGGIVAMEKVLQTPADGYTLCACTKSNIAKVVSVGREGYLDAFDWLALLLTDPECVITRTDSPLADFAKLIANGQDVSDPQTWLGPASGGLDHVMAMRIWDKFQVKGKWIPYASGGQALTDLLGGRGDAYVGNPADVAGNPELQVSVVSSPKRLPHLPNVPVFSEFGAADLDDEYMWRGFAIKKGCPPAALQWYAELFQKVTQDPEWRRVWEKEGMQVVYLAPEEFRSIIGRDREVFREYLERLDMVPLMQTAKQPAWASWVQAPGLTTVVLVIVAVATWIVHRGRWDQYGTRVILGSLLAIALLFFAQSQLFPYTTGVGAAAVPQLWIGILGLLIAIAWIRATPTRIADSSDATTTEPQRETSRRPSRVAGIIGLLAIYVVITFYLGYYISSFVFLVTTMWLLGEKRWRVLLPVAGAWLAFAYLTFERLLYVHLPAGRWFEL
jgi:tripartite-type tricarboxylate transporter receptor subunit TctC